MVYTHPSCNACISGQGLVSGNTRTDLTSDNDAQDDIARLINKNFAEVVSQMREVEVKLQMRVRYLCHSISAY